MPKSRASPAAPLFVKATCEHGCGYSEDPTNFFQKLSTDPVAAFTCVLAVFTLGLIVVGAIQSWLIGRQIKLSREEFNATHRARLEVRFVRVLENRAIEITVINTGTGSAKFVAARAGIWHLLPGEQFPSPHDLLPGNAFDLRSTFAPSEADRYVVTGVTDDFLAGFGNPAYVFGWILYDTVGPNPVRRTTYFGRRTEPNQPELVPVEGSDWNFIQ